MSINFSHFGKNLFFLLIFQLFYSSETLAWIGYEEKTNDMIDVFSETEIEIGSDISYYDFGAKQYRNGFVTFTDSAASGFRVELKDIETNKTRVFIMDQD